MDVFKKENCVEKLLESCLVKLEEISRNEEDRKFIARAWKAYIDINKAFEGVSN